MPSVSKKQHNLMAAVANNPKFAKKTGIPKSVGEDFMEADKGKKFRTGGSTNPAKGKFNRPRSNHGMMQLPNYSLERFRGKKAGGILTKNEKVNEMKNMKKGGMPMVMKDGKKVPSFAADGKGKMAKGGMTKMMGGGMAMKKMAKGGGIEVKGKTKGTMIKMKSGGKAC